MDVPYKEMMVVTSKTYEQVLNNQHSPTYNEQEEDKIPEKINWDNVKVKIDINQTKQFVTMYKNLMEFNNGEIQHKINIPKMTFAGEKDTIVCGENFGNVTVDIVGTLQKRVTELGVGYRNSERK
ncbi:hypothetical protein M4D62_11565 [Priestia megaterium]|nr:hypothetical protein [Priestia megaterium]MCM3543600.1 hypothetical protein [Priestia megaterium]